MPHKGNPKIEFRYYKMPQDVPFLALFGDKWIQNYGRDIDFLHFHNYLEIGYCYDEQAHCPLEEKNTVMKAAIFR